MSRLESEKKYYTFYLRNLGLIAFEFFTSISIAYVSIYVTFFIDTKVEWFAYVLLVIVLALSVFIFIFAIKACKNWRGSLFLVIADDHMECLPYTKEDTRTAHSFQGILNFTITRKDLKIYPFSEIKEVADATTFWGGQFIEITKNNNDKITIPVLFETNKERLEMLDELQTKLEIHKNSAPN